MPFACIVLISLMMFCPVQGNDDTTINNVANESVDLGVASHENAILTPAAGWGVMQFEAPVPGSYQLPPFGKAANGDVLDADNQAKKLADFFGDKFGEKSNDTSKKHQSKKKKATTTTGSTKYNRASENPMSSNASNNKNKNNNRDKPARVYDDGIRVRAGTDTSIDYTARNNSNRHNNNKSNPPVKIYDDGIRVRPMSVDPYEKIEKSRSKKSVFNSHAKEKITKDASSRNRSIKTKRYDNKKNDTANAKNKTVNRPMENAPMSTNTKIHIPTPPMKKDHTSNKSRRLSQQSRKTSTQKDNTINNSNNNNSNKNNTEQKLFKYTVIHGKDYGNSKIEIKKKKTRQSNNNNNNISEQKSKKLSNLRCPFSKHCKRAKKS